MVRITNQMIADEIKRRGMNPDNLSTWSIDLVWQDLREAAGHEIKMIGSGLSERPASTMSEDRADKIYDLVIA